MPATPIWENPSSSAHCRSCARSCGPSGLRGVVMGGILGTRKLDWADEAGCAACATRLARHPGLRGAFIALHGPLGAGKTTFVRHLLRALGVTGRIRSPTYAVLEPHEAGDLAISHLDFYRFADPREWEDAGLREVFAQPGLKLAEWPERVPGRLPLPDLRLHIEPGGPRAPEGRIVRAEALTSLGLTLLEAFAPESAAAVPYAA